MNLGDCVLLRTGYHHKNATSKQEHWRIATLPLRHLWQALRSTNVSCWPLLWRIFGDHNSVSCDETGYLYLSMTPQPRYSWSTSLGYTPSCLNKYIVSCPTWRNYLLVKTRDIPSVGKLPKIMVSWNLNVSALLITVTPHYLPCKILCPDSVKSYHEFRNP